MRLRKTIILFVILLMTVSMASAYEYSYHYRNHHWHDRYSWWEDDEYTEDNQNVPPETPSNYSWYTIEKLCRNDACWVGADGQYIFLRNNVSAKNPSYKQLVSFLKNDKTDEKSYTDTYMCSEFAKTVHDNAERHGIKCAWLACIGANHAFNAVKTTDRGLVYFDCTGVPGGSKKQDKIVNIEIGEPLTEEYLFRDGGFFMSGNVKRVVVFW